MRRTLLVLGGMLLLALFTFSSVGLAANIPIGYIEWDIITPNDGEFNIVNETGPVNSGDDFMSLTSVTLSDLLLVVDFVDPVINTEQTFSAPFSPFGGGGFNGPILPAGSLITSATLTGKYSPLDITLGGGTTGTILENFTATILPSIGSSLQEGDLQIFDAVFTPNATTVPEPSTLLLLGTGFASLVLLRRKKS